MEQGFPFIGKNGERKGGQSKTQSVRQPNFGAAAEVVGREEVRSGIICWLINLLYPFGYALLFHFINIPERGFMRDPLIVFIKERRKTLGLTQHELADRAGVGLRFIRDLEQGKESLRLDKVNQVLGLFGRRMEPTTFQMEVDDASG
jgi:y4mF family transcriptional regulator